jgi:hypothetical protein
MEVCSRRLLLAGFGALLGLAPLARAEDPRPANPDADFLEYLGSDDSAPELDQYLSKADASDKQTPKPAPKQGSSRT